MDNDLRIRSQILEMMAEKGVRQAQLARQLEITPQSLNQVLKNERAKLPSSLVAILDALDLELVAQPKTDA